jgi:hypothetical protein
MKSERLFLATLPLLLLLTGCPFASKIPFGAPERHSIDPRLAGSWISRTADGDSAQILVLPFSDAEYFLESRDYRGRVDRYRAYLVPIAGERVLQINELSSDPPDAYVLARYALAADGSVTLRFLGEKAVPESLKSNPAGLIGFLTARWNDPTLYDEDTRMVLRPATGRE